MRSLMRVQAARLEWAGANVVIAVTDRGSGNERLRHVRVVYDMNSINKCRGRPLGIKGP